MNYDITNSERAMYFSILWLVDEDERYGDLGSCIDSTRAFWNLTELN